MDMRMPVMDGREATRRIKSAPGGGSVPIIALTATAFDQDREQILLDGCDDFVRKPIRFDEILETLIKHLKVRFIYREEAHPMPDSPEPRIAVASETIEALALQPPEWVDALRQATERADLYRITDLVGRIGEEYPNLAEALADLTERFEYREILGLIEEARSAK
jgi:CheY-like chemotaxis protein